MSARKRLPPVLYPDARVQITFDVTPHGSLDELLDAVRRAIRWQFQAELKAWTVTLGRPGHAPEDSARGARGDDA